MNCAANKPFPQREICGAGVCAQALRCAAHNDGDSLTGATLEDIRARLLRHRTDAHSEDDVAVKRDAEVGREGEQVRHDAGERGGEACAWCGQAQVSAARAG